MDGRGAVRTMDLSQSVKKRINKSAALRAKVLAGPQIDGTGGQLGLKFVVSYTSIMYIHIRLDA